MKLFSTRDNNHKSIYKDAIFQGLTPDGGLYFPESFPDMSDFIKNCHGMSFNSIAEHIVYELIKDETSKDSVKRIVNNAFTFKPEIMRVSEDISILELYTGPTCAFKDYGASFLASSMEEFLGDRKEKAVILAATSGDTGSAVAKAFEGKDNIEVVILYPSGKVSPLQEKQLTTIGGNITALEVKGTFDDCQKMVKEAFGNKDLKSKVNITSANSINIGRLVPQSLYYIYAYSQLKPGSDLMFTVPSGNFGNLTAGLFAKKWGLPVKQFIAATNNNKIVPEFLDSGIYNPRPSVQTPSNAMDVGAPSNFERMMTMFDSNVENFRKVIKGDFVNDEDTIKTMQRYYSERGQILDPHTAVGILATERFQQANSEAKKYNSLVLSTAHPGKFVEVVEDAIKVSPQLPAALSSLLNKEKVSTVIGNEYSELEKFLVTNY
ncbi:threonine synthase [Thiospirochaeta perfilievii]|uniref:Threonine synthase n=1 Tax=Thiospirochaeta perfilievii TaxID=252967 RepID=A0A5C1QB91_9SPIO|nr:threonine synthase [Thiospirochaeta perfilievii]QEN04767.1 threonine synthase [Thiospirochaeta perfilievii]